MDRTCAVLIPVVYVCVCAACMLCVLCVCVLHVCMLCVVCVWAVKEHRSMQSNHCTVVSLANTCRVLYGEHHLSCSVKQTAMLVVPHHTSSVVTH